MFRFITPLILIAIAVTTFLAYTDPMYQKVLAARAEAASYDEALNNAKMLEVERDNLTKKDSAILPENKEKLKKLLPDNIDNIRLILEIGQIASPYGMMLKDVKYDTLKEEANSAVVAGGQSPEAMAALRRDYGTWNLEFETEGTYNNFLNFLKDLESNLRIVDVASISFTSDSSTKSGTGSTTQDVYKYNFKIKTYWLKN